MHVHTGTFVRDVLQYIYKKLVRGGGNVEEKRMERARQAAWDKRKLRTVSTHLTVAEYELLQQVCERKGKTPYHVLREYLQHYISAAMRNLQI